MRGAIIGDISGSIYEFDNLLTKDFGPLLKINCRATDDTIMTCAVAHWLLLKEDGHDYDVRKILKLWGKVYPDAGYGRKFFDWVLSDDMEPYNSCGNGAAMRISPVGFYAKSFEECIKLSRAVTEVTHNHPEGLAGAECVARIIFEAKDIKDKEYLAEIAEAYYYDNDIFGQSLEEMRRGTNGMHGKEICQYSVPQAINCFLWSNSFEDCIRNCISIGGDSDTIACIAGGIAEAYYGEEEVKQYWNQAKELYLIDNQCSELIDIFEDLCKNRK